MSSASDPDNNTIHLSIRYQGKELLLISIPYYIRAFEGSEAAANFCYNKIRERVSIRDINISVEDDHKLVAVLTVGHIIKLFIKCETHNYAVGQIIVSEKPESMVWEKCNYTNGLMHLPPLKLISKTEEKIQAFDSFLAQIEDRQNKIRKNFNMASVNNEEPNGYWYLPSDIFNQPYERSADEIHAETHVMNIVEKPVVKSVIDQLLDECFSDSTSSSSHKSSVVQEFDADTLPSYLKKTEKEAADELERQKNIERLIESLTLKDDSVSIVDQVSQLTSGITMGKIGKLGSPESREVAADCYLKMIFSKEENKSTENKLSMTEATSMNVQTSSNIQNILEMEMALAMQRKKMKKMNSIATSTDEFDNKESRRRNSGSDDKVIVTKSKKIEMPRDSEEKKGKKDDRKWKKPEVRPTEGSKKRRELRMERDTHILRVSGVAESEIQRLVEEKEERRQKKKEEKALQRLKDEIEAKMAKKETSDATTEDEEANDKKYRKCSIKLADKQIVAVLREGRTWCLGTINKRQAFAKIFKFVNLSRKSIDKVELKLRTSKGVTLIGEKSFSVGSGKHIDVQIRILKSLEESSSDAAIVDITSQNVKIGPTLVVDMNKEICLADSHACLCKNDVKFADPAILSEISYEEKRAKLQVKSFDEVMSLLKEPRIMATLYDVCTFDPKYREAYNKAIEKQRLTAISQWDAEKSRLDAATEKFLKKKAEEEKVKQNVVNVIEPSDLILNKTCCVHTAIADDEPLQNMTDSVHTSIADDEPLQNMTDSVHTAIADDEPLQNMTDSVHTAIADDEPLQNMTDSVHTAIADDEPLQNMTDSVHTAIADDEPLQNMTDSVHTAIGEEERIQNMIDSLPDYESIQKMLANIDSADDISIPDLSGQKLITEYFNIVNKEVVESIRSSIEDSKKVGQQLITDFYLPTTSLEIQHEKTENLIEQMMEKCLSVLREKNDEGLQRQQLMTEFITYMENGGSSQYARKDQANEMTDSVHTAIEGVDDRQMDCSIHTALSPDDQITHSIHKTVDDLINMMNNTEDIEQFHKIDDILKMMNNAEDIEQFHKMSDSVLASINTSQVFQPADEETDDTQSSSDDDDDYEVVEKEEEDSEDSGSDFDVVNAEN